MEALCRLQPQLEQVRAQLQRGESLALLELVRQLLGDGRDADPRTVAVPGMPVKPEIGSCSQAEEFFLELAHGRVRRHGKVNCFVDAAGRARLLEKMNLGESHSAIVIEPIAINGVTIPPGGLCALRYVEPLPECRPSVHGSAMPLEAIAEARFLRLTTLSAPPETRRRAFGAQVEAQVRARMVSPLTTTLDDLRHFAGTEVG